MVESFLGFLYNEICQEKENGQIKSTKPKPPNASQQRKYNSSKSRKNLPKSSPIRKRPEKTETPIKKNEKVTLNKILKDKPQITIKPKSHEHPKPKPKPENIPTHIQRPKKINSPPKHPHKTPRLHPDPPKMNHFEKDKGEIENIKEGHKTNGFVKTHTKAFYVQSFLLIRTLIMNSIPSSLIKFREILLILINGL